MFYKLTANLTTFEKTVLAFIEEHGELLTSDLPPRMMGAVPNLKNWGLVAVYKRRVTIWASKKRKFVRVIKEL